MENQYIPHTDLIQKAVDLDDRTLSDIRIVAYEVESFNRLKNPNSEDKNRLQRIIGEFNNDQRFHALRGKYETPKELIDGWINKQKIAQIKLVQHSSNKKYCIAFNTAFVSFEEFYQNHTQAFPKYGDYFKALSTLCAVLYDNILLATTGQEPLASYHIYTYTHKRNPYQKFSVSPNLATMLSHDLLQKPNQAKIALREIINTFQPECCIKHFPSIASKWVFISLAQGKPIGDIFQSVIFLSWMTANNLFTSNSLFDISPQKEITRHISWCVHENKRRCMKLEIECHSSINCPFYANNPHKH